MSTDNLLLMKPIKKIGLGASRGRWIPSAVRLAVWSDKVLRGLGAPAPRHHGFVPLTAADAITNAHAWFETHSGWAPPDADTIADWMADGVCRCPDECVVAPDRWCQHGLASWWLVLSSLDQPERA